MSVRTHETPSGWAASWPLSDQVIHLLPGPSRGKRFASEMEARFAAEYITSLGKRPATLDPEEPA